MGVRSLVMACNDYYENEPPHPDYARPVTDSRSPIQTALISVRFIDLSHDQVGPVEPLRAKAQRTSLIPYPVSPYPHIPDPRIPILRLLQRFLKFAFPETSLEMQLSNLISTLMQPK